MFIDYSIDKKNNLFRIKLKCLSQFSLMCLSTYYVIINNETVFKY